MLNILVVEDDAIMGTLLKKMLIQLGCKKVWICSNAICALETIRKEEIDLIFMDINIEGPMDGIQCAKEITLQKDVLITFATSYADESILEEAIDINTLNYLVKPYGKKDIEITLNLAKVSRKKQKIALTKTIPTIINIFDKYSLDTVSRKLKKDGNEINLSKKEFDLLILLAIHSSELVTKEQILQSVWKNRSIASSTLRETITRIRKKLPNIEIKAIHGMGYQLNES